MTVTSWPIDGRTDAPAQIFTSGGTGVVLPNTGDVVLNGVATTFALTFPIAGADHQYLRLMFQTAVSVAFSVVGSGDGSTILGAPTTGAANTGICWQYALSTKTWYRQY
jgi:hypothetical protein